MGKTTSAAKARNPGILSFPVAGTSFPVAGTSRFRRFEIANTAPATTSKRKTTANVTLARLSVLAGQDTTSPATRELPGSSRARCVPDRKSAHR